MKILITGAEGYIGHRLVHAARKKHHEVVLLSRNNHYALHEACIAYDLNARVLPALPDDTDAIVHLATDRNADECRAAELLLKASISLGAKFIFMSSQTARDDAPTAYGQTKWHIEQAVLSSGGWVIRAGQVYGGVEQALFGRLVDMVRNWAMLPMFLPAPHVQPIHVDDLSLGVLTLIARDDIPPCILKLGAAKPILFKDFLACIARSRLYKQPKFIPCPTLVISCFSYVFSKSRGIKEQLQQLTSLLELTYMKTEASLALLDLSLRSCVSGMHKSGSDRRRKLLIEGKVLLNYVLKKQPKYGLLSRYVRSIEALRQGESMVLPWWAKACPAFLACLERPRDHTGSVEKEFIWRLNTATVLAEATPEGVPRFMNTSVDSKRYSSMAHIMWALLREVGWRLLSVVFRPRIQ